MSDTIGDRIAIYRKRKGMTQAQLAGLVGRSESWLSQVERGIRSVDKMSILIEMARLLGVNVQTLAGQPWRYAPNGGPQLETLDAIRSALTGYTHLLGSEPSPWPMPQLRAAIVEVHRAYQAAEYVKTATMLPDVLVAVDAYGDTSGETHLARCSAYVAASKLLTKVGEAHLAWISADRAATAALAADSVSAQAQAAYQVVCALLRADRTEEAERIAVTSAERVSPTAREDRPDRVSLAGALWLISAIIAGRRADRQEANRRLTTASALADTLGTDGNFAWTAFGPTNVNIHRASAAAEMGDPQEVIENATMVNTDELAPGLNSRRSQVHLDLAWAEAQRRRDAEAILHLLEVERVAPESLRHHIIAHELIREMLKRERRSRTPALRQLATRAGVLQ